MSTPCPDVDRQARLALLGELAEMGGLSSLLSGAIAARAGINTTDLESLDLLRRHGPMTAGRLAELTGLTTGAVTGVIDRLDRRGYAHRQADPADRRRVIVAANLERATGDLAPLFASLDIAMTAAVAGYSAAELMFLTDASRRINDALRATVVHLREP